MSPRPAKTPPGPSAATIAEAHRAPTPSALRLDRFLCFSVSASNNAFGRLYKPLLDALDLTYAQYLVMVVLWEHDDRTVGEVGEALALESNTLSPLLKRMEAAGLLRRTRDPGDERQVRLRLTEQGQALRERAEAIPACVFAATGLELSEVERMVTDLNRLRAALTAP